MSLLGRVLQMQHAIARFAFCSCGYLAPVRSIILRRHRSARVLLTASPYRTSHTLLFFPPVQLKLLRSLRLRFAHNGGLERFRPSGFTHLIVFSACAIKIAPFTSLALRSQRRLGTVSPFGLLPLQNPFGLHTPYCLVALSSLGLRFAPVGISRRCARLSYVAIVVHGSCSPQAPIAPVLFSPINKHIPSLSLSA